MSKKDFLNQLKRPARGDRWTSSPRPSPAPSTGGPTTRAEKVEKRISGTVIRRRRRREAGRGSVQDALPKAMPTIRRRRVASSQAEQAGAPVEEPTQAPPLAEEPAAELLSAEEPAELIEPTEPTVEEEQPPAEPVAEGAAPEPPEEPVVPEPPAEVQAEEPASELEEAAPAAVAPQPEPLEEAQPEPSEAAQEPAQAAAEPVKAVPEPEPQAEPVAPPESSTVPAVEEQGPPTVQVDRRPRPGSEVSKLPSLSDQRPPQSRDKFALGKAVVKPPPGYDPNDPLGSRQRAKEAAEASVRATRGSETPDWRQGERDKPPPPQEDPRRQRRGRPRRKPRRAGRVEMVMDDMPREARRRRRTRRSGVKRASPQPKAQKRRIQLDNEISVGSLAKEMSLKAAQVIRVLMGMGQPARINDMLDFDTAQLVAAEFQYDVVDIGFKEEEHMIQVDQAEEEEAAQPRPPVVTMMGHVDHGKTSLLDYIRSTKIAAGEAGGITQHIGAYQVEHEGQLISFIDTPGHAAFTEMRARGANATDIVILVVAADDGVMPQTVESINHTRAAGVPIVVAINKCDKRGVKPDLVRQRLMDHNLVPEEYGGETLMVDVSAITGAGISDLLDAVMLQSEMAELTANPDRHGEGVVLESRLEKGRGPVALVVVQQGTLSRGDSIVVGCTSGRVRAMSDFRGKKLKIAGPATPVEIMGLGEVPVAGDNFTVVENDKAARALAEHRAETQRRSTVTRREKVTFEDLFSRMQQGEAEVLNLVVKADVQGSVEALKGSLDKLDVEGAELKVLHDAVGAISESDITLASAYGAVVVGFNIRPDPKARKAAERHGVDIRTYTVIYELLDDIRAAMVGLLAPVIEENYEGTAEVRNLFQIPKAGTVAGCYVQDGRILRNAGARLVRDGVPVWEGKLASLRRFKDDVREVQTGFECGIGLEAYNDIKVGDLIEVFSKVEVAAKA